MTHEEKTLCLIDGSGYIFRAFYALPAMTRDDGTPVNAVYGFCNMLMNLTLDNPCSHMAVVFDAARKNFRNDIYPAYKENRKETPPDLVPQMPLIRAATKAFNVPSVEMEGFEADDLIATYARLAAAQGFSVRVISADKDLMQLIRPGVSLYDPMKKKEVGDAEVRDKFGVAPDKVIDVQALMGDASDNIPGASGIGPKTAGELISTFGSLDNLLNRLNEIPQPKRREGLVRDREQILMSRRLVTLDAHAPADDNLEIFRCRTPDLATIQNFMEQNRFKSLLPKIDAWRDKRNRMVEQPGQPQFVCITDEKALKDVINKVMQKQYVAFDTETDSLIQNTARLVGFSLCCDADRAYYVPLRHGKLNRPEAADLFSAIQDDAPHQMSVQTALNLLRPVLENKSVLKIGHNIKFDRHILANEMPDVAFESIADTMVMSYDLDGSKHGHGLDELADLFLNHKMITYAEVCGTGKNKITFDKVPLDKACAYAAEDAWATFRLYQKLNRAMEQSSVAAIYHEVDLPLVSILFKMERRGILVDQAHLKKLGHTFAGQLDDLTRRIHALAQQEFNINSPAQLGTILFEKMNLSGGRRGANGAWTTDADVLETLAESGVDIAARVLEYRMVSKLKNTYVEALLNFAQTDPRIHTSFSITGTNTGRLSSSDPNLQNIPIRTELGKEIRRAFIAQKGCKLISADYSQIELRLMAEVADVKGLKDSFRRNEDIHARTASQIFGIPLEQIDADTRRRAKAINFGIIYGISPFGLAGNLGISREESKKYIDAYFAQYPEIKSYMDKTIQFAEKNGYVETPMGRRCVIAGFDRGNTRGFAARAAINAPIQGGAADIIKLAMIRIARALAKTNLKAEMLLQVHDELVFEVADADVDAVKSLLKSEMENVVRMSVPLIADVGVGDNWKDAH